MPLLALIDYQTHQQLGWQLSRSGESSTAAAALFRDWIQLYPPAHIKALDMQTPPELML